MKMFVSAWQIVPSCLPLVAKLVELQLTLIKRNRFADLMAQVVGHLLVALYLHILEGVIVFLALFG